MLREHESVVDGFRSNLPHTSEAVNETAPSIPSQLATTIVTQSRTVFSVLQAP